MSIQHHLPTSTHDDIWISTSITQLGDEKFWEYKTKVYDFLDSMDVGQWVSVEKIAKPESIDLFMKIAYCYITESESCYAFKNDYSQIKKHFDAREMEKTFALFKKQRECKNSGADGGGTAGESEGLKSIFALQPAVPNNE